MTRGEGGKGVPLTDRSEFQNGTKFEWNEVWWSIDLLRRNSFQEQVVKIHAPGKRLDPRPLIFSMRPNIVPVILLAGHTIRRHARCIRVDAIRRARAHVWKHRNPRPHFGHDLLQRSEHFLPRSGRHITVSV